MTISRMLYLKRNQVILFACILSGAAFLLLDALSRGKWQCSDRKPEKYYDVRGAYIVLYNYVAAERRFGCAEAVTYCAHADLLSLDSVRAVAESYDGPMSVAVYCPGRDFMRTAEAVARMRSCHPEVAALVTFHAVFDVDRFPTGAAIPLFESYRDEPACRTAAGPNESEAARDDLPYPINVLRNAARDGSATRFVLSADLPLTPSPGFSSSFARMAGRAPNHRPPAVFVPPAFVVDVAPPPPNKSALGGVLARGDGDVYQHLDCAQCHAVPGMSYKRWLRSGGSGGALGVAFAARRSAGWQPFFVGTRSDPRFDERYAWRGVKDRQGQMYSMCAAGYDFLVLDNAYLTYRRGSGAENVNAAVEGYQKYLDALDRDFLMIFGPNDRCYLPKGEVYRSV